MAADFIMKGLEMKQKDAHFQQAMDNDLEWKRGSDGLPTSYDEGAIPQHGSRDYRPSMRMPLRRPVESSDGC
jgi:hypothetical protein